MEEKQVGKIIFKSVSPFGADENFTLEFEYDADDGLNAHEMARMCRSFASAYGFSEKSVVESFADPYGDD